MPAKASERHRKGEKSEKKGRSVWRAASEKRKREIPLRLFSGFEGGKKKAFGP